MTQISCAAAQQLFGYYIRFMTALILIFRPDNWTRIELLSLPLSLSRIPCSIWTVADPRKGITISFFSTWKLLAQWLEISTISYCVLLISHLQWGQCNPPDQEGVNNACIYTILTLKIIALKAHHMCDVTSQSRLKKNQQNKKQNAWHYKTNPSKLTGLWNNCKKNPQL